MQTATTRSPPTKSAPRNGITSSKPTRTATGASQATRSRRASRAARSAASTARSTSRTPRRTAPKRRYSERFRFRRTPKGAAGAPSFLTVARTLGRLFVRPRVALGELHAIGEFAAAVRRFRLRATIVLLRSTLVAHFVVRQRDAPRGHRVPTIREPIAIADTLGV